MAFETYLELTVGNQQAGEILKKGPQLIPQSGFFKLLSHPFILLYSFAK